MNRSTTMWDRGYDHDPPLVGGVQIVSTVLKFVPLLLVATVGLFFVDTDNFGPFNASGDSVPGALAASAALSGGATSHDGPAVANEPNAPPR